MYPDRTTSKAVRPLSAIPSSARARTTTTQAQTRPRQEWSSKSPGRDKSWSAASAALHSGHYADAIIRSEGNRLKEGMQESIDIAQASGNARGHLSLQAGWTLQLAHAGRDCRHDRRVARARAMKGPEHAAIDLVIEDGTRLGAQISR